MKILITGSGGQLGSALQRTWRGRRRDELLARSRRELDITRPADQRRALLGARPDVVINAAASTQVDACESQHLRALRVNAAAVDLLAGLCRETGAFLVHVSTDYVFDGSATQPYPEDAEARPINFYGVSKLLGERAVRRCLPERHLIVRTSGLYGTPAAGRAVSFVSRVLERARAGETLRVVDDQVCSPTYAEDLAEMVWRLIDDQVQGTVHVTNSGACSWYEFARACLHYAGLETAVEPIEAMQLAAAPRPAFSVLANSRLAALGYEPPRPWQEALRDYVDACQFGAS